MLLGASFTTVVTVAYIMVEKVGLGLDVCTGTVIGLVVGLLSLAVFLVMRPRLTPEDDDPAIEAKPTEAERVGDNLAF